MLSFMLKSNFSWKFCYKVLDDVIRNLETCNLKASTKQSLAMKKVHKSDSKRIPLGKQGRDKDKYFLSALEWLVFCC